MLEDIITGDGKKPSLKEELEESFRNYPSNWKKYFRQLWKPITISMVGSALGQWGAHKMGWDSNFALTASAYVCGYVPGYSWFFLSEYRQNKEKYGSIISKEFGKFLYTFMAADYVADILTFSPTFISSNVWMANHTELHPAARSMIAWGAGAFLYMTAIAGMHPVTMRLNEALNRQVKKSYHALKGVYRRLTDRSPTPA